MIKNKFITHFGLIIMFVILNINPCFSQKNLAGKVYSMLYSTSCKEFSDGGCIINTYCKLKFDQKTVTVSYSSKADCTMKEKEKLYEKEFHKVYDWYIIKNVIHFKDFDDFGTLTLSQDNSLVGKRIPSDKADNLEFIEESK